MLVDVPHPAFAHQRLSIRPAGLFQGQALCLNGAPVKRRKGAYMVRNDQGEEVVVRLKQNFIDPLPQVVIGAETVSLARPLVWYEYLWISLPILLIFIGGAVGAGIGLTATYVSSRVLRSDRRAGVKYLLTGLISLTAALTFWAAALAIQSFLGPEVTSQRFLAQIAREASQDLPKRLDQDTEFLSVTGLEGVLRYQYRLVNWRVADLDLDHFKTVMKKPLVQTACANPELRQELLDQGVILRHTYVDQHDAHVVSFDVTSRECSP